MEDRSVWFLYNDDGTKMWLKDWSVPLQQSTLWRLEIEDKTYTWFAGCEEITEAEVMLKYRYKIYYSDFDLNVFSDIVYGDYEGVLEPAPLVKQ